MIIGSYSFIFLAPPVFITLFFKNAPYGRYSRNGWGFIVNAKLAWLTQEIPSLLVAAFLIFSSERPFYRHFSEPGSLLCTCFLVHYSYRSIYFPLMMRGSKGTPISVWMMSFAFCLINGFLQGWNLSKHAPTVWRFHHFVGLALWLFGWINVVVADRILRNLRKPGEIGVYRVPQGGLFRYVSAANYCSEVIEWSGFAIACASFPSTAFALFTFCNLAPRAIEHHKYYLQKIEDYPKDRKAFIPFLW
uniref:3-oxo-5-alpha-steroid 4-dehydrogenase C-terminal domain-containing protein n=1 Tax=Polytomella parva TaxID=51329 RepID=A0A7S0YE34_9CHLO